MPRYRITIEYDGTPFVGWQRQSAGVSIQGELERAIHGFSGETVSVRGAGRTDAGVHALAQVAHFDLERTWEPFRIREAANFHLRPSPIAVLDAQEVSGEFDARFSATKRHYAYWILARRSPPILDKNRVWWIDYDLDVGAMQAAAEVFVGRHDFTTFRAAKCQAASPIKTIDRFDVRRRGEHVLLTVEARSFLHRQVRSMVGSLKLVGDGKWSQARLGDALAACNREACGPVSPAAGLYLAAVEYGEAAAVVSDAAGLRSPLPGIPDA